MASKTFNLSDASESSASCAKLAIFMCCLIGVGVAAVVSVVAYKSSNFGGSEGCNVPILDENGLSNWTNGANKVAFACFPGYFLEGHSNILVSNCSNGTWNPDPPACNFLPLKLECEIDHHGLNGNISMWQESDHEPGFIFGVVSYEDVDRKAGNFLGVIHISKSHCHVSDEVSNVPRLDEKPNENSLKIEYNSTELKAYNKAEIHISLIFVDANTTASLVSVHQDEHTFVLPNSLSFSRFSRGSLTKIGLENYF